MYNVTRGWLRENFKDYSFFMNSFLEAEAYEQAAIMVESDEKFYYFLNISKLSGLPLILRKKDFYLLDELKDICIKLKYSQEEAAFYCIENYQHRY